MNRLAILTLTRIFPLFLALLGNAVAADGVASQVGDAYVRSANNGTQWVIGTAAVELAFESQGGVFKLAGFRNKLCSPPVEYVDTPTTSTPFSLTSGHVVETIWSKDLAVAPHIDLAAENLRVKVARGEMLGFRVGPLGEWKGDQIRWISELAYDDGESYSSAQDTKLDQGPVWYYYLHQRETGFLDKVDSMWGVDGAVLRGPSMESGATAQRGLWQLKTRTPRLDGKLLSPSMDFDVLRVWKAPRDGTVTLKGKAERLGSKGRLAVVKFNELPSAAVDSDWKLQRGAARQVSHGGRPAAQLDLVLQRGPLEARLHVIAFPGTSVLKQWVEFVNPTAAPLDLAMKSPSPALLWLRGSDASAYTNYWMIGGNSQPNQGNLERAAVNAPYHRLIETAATWGFVPWTGLLRKDGPKDGLFVALEYLGRWKLTVDHERSGPIRLAASVADFKPTTLKPGEIIELPEVIVGVFRNDLDDMGRALYNWQYEYMWDYTSHEYYTRTHCSVGGSGGSCLQERWAGLVADRGMEWIDHMRTMGFEMYWYDAVWGAPRNWWENSWEGPDFARVNRFLAKNDMKLIVWITHHLDPGLLDTKVGSWGSFQRREDGMGITPAWELPLDLVPWSIGFDPECDRSYRKDRMQFLDSNPRSSIHTCSGGATYSLTFEGQRLSDLNYDQDPPGGDIINYYWSYLATPDKWMDALNSATWWKHDEYGRSRVYDPDTGRRMLAGVPHWGAYVTADDMEQLRMILDLYRYLLRQGVAGRWSYISHPVITGDKEHHYIQRLSHDRRKSIIILKHRSTGKVTVFPRGLISEQNYLVDFDSVPGTGVTKTGAELMRQGIEVVDQKSGELIYLNLPHRPRGGRDKTPPKAPTNALIRRENNIGHTGVGVYWSPGADENWISYYEIRRDGKLLGKASVGNHYFDRASGWNLAGRYAVRAVDGDGNASEWADAKPIAHEPLRVSALGAHFTEAGREGWRAETTTDGQTFQPMKWLPQQTRKPVTDLGGTSLQPGGAEGCWEGEGRARVGRGWQQASPAAMCARSWTAPRTGQVRIVGRAIKDYWHYKEGGTLRVRIQLGRKQLWPETGWAEVEAGNLTGVAHDLTARVAAGEVIRFVLDRGADWPRDILAWMPEIIYEDAPPQGRGPSPVRILCGASEPYTDRQGNIWLADKFFSGGTATSTTASIEPTFGWLDDERLYQSGREGAAFTYAIPVSNGLYSLRLKFAEPSFHHFERPFNLDVNGQRMLRNFDIAQAARGPRRAYDKLIRSVVPDGQGRIVLRFSNGWEPINRLGNAMLQAIELQPEIKPVIRVNAGSTSDFVDWNSFVWSADTNFNGGGVIESQAPVEHASPTLYDQDLYRTARNGQSFRYTFSLPQGLYNVHLKFAELWLKEPGGRPMDIEINGQFVRRSWDPATASGKPGRAAELRLEDVVPDQRGQITIKVTAVGEENAILQGIEIE